MWGLKWHFPNTASLYREVEYIARIICKFSINYGFGSISPFDTPELIEKLQSFTLKLWQIHVKTGLEIFTMENLPKNHRIIFLWFIRYLCIIFCVLFLAFWSNTSSAEIIKIGEINPLSGRLAKNGIEIHQGIEVAVAKPTKPEVLTGSSYVSSPGMIRANRMWPSPGLKNYVDGKKCGP